MATSPPSQFAAILRQSKFASFDPQISQVYASFGGHAHRGNWGLKRSLPLRKRKATVTIRAVDSRQQQTEWQSAEPQHRWIQMWDEVGITPELSFRSHWRATLGHMGDIKWDMDSEFGQATKDIQAEKEVEAMAVEGENGEVLLMEGSEGEVPGEGEKKRKGEVEQSPTPNIQAMSEKEFQRHLKKLREMRPSFREFIQSDKSPSKSLWEQSANPKELHAQFLSTQAYHQYTSPDSRLIQQQPQRYAGLTYSQMSPLQAQFINKPQPGRILQHQQQYQQQNRRVSPGDYTASFAGMTPSVHKASRGDRTPIDWQKLSVASSPEVIDYERSIVPDFRLRKVELVRPPPTVGENPCSVDRVSMNMEVFANQGKFNALDNGHIPGSKEYIVTQDLRSSTSTMIKPAPPRTKNASFKQTEGAKQDIMTTLNSIAYQRKR